METFTLSLSPVLMMRSPYRDMTKPGKRQEKTRAQDSAAVEEKATLTAGALSPSVEPSGFIRLQATSEFKEVKQHGKNSESFLSYY